MRSNRTIAFFAILILGGLPCFQVVSQTPAPAPEKTQKLEKRKTVVSTRVNPVIVQNENLAPQIVTILHRLNGIKVFRLLVRSNEELAAIAGLDDAFKITNDVHVNVIAGLALDDGRTIAAWLPEAEAEMPPLAFQYAPEAPPAPEAAPMAPHAPAPRSAPDEPTPTVKVRQSMPGLPWPASYLEPADLKIVTRDGKRIPGRYVGIDGVTGLSVITLAENSLPAILEPKENTITAGLRLRLLGPQPAPRPETSAKNGMYVRIGETEAIVSKVTHSPAGSISRIRVKSPKLSAANMGGIAINDAGETVGIVGAVAGNEATIVPVALVRSAAKRVIARQSSVPRPWLGIRGEPVGAMSLDKIQGVGWQLERARELAEKNYGILLTSVVPGSPAALNHLKPGDVILSVNNEDIRNGEEFSWLLQEAGPGGSVSFRVASPGKATAEALEVKLSESPDPFFGFRVAQGAPMGFDPGSLMAQGIETIAIKPKVAMRFGSNGGLLVVYVQPATEAFKAGLRPGDVIEAIDGKRLLGMYHGSLLKNLGASSTFNIVRNKQRLTFTISTPNNSTPNK